MIVDKSIFRWDGYSDQPATVDRRIKRRLRWRCVRDELRKSFMSLALSGRVLSPLLFGRKAATYYNDGLIGLCLNLERPFANKKILSASDILEIIGSLNLNRIAVRIPLHDIDRIEDYADFINHFSDYRILAVILQNRESIEDKRRLEDGLRRVFSALSGSVDTYQIGNAVNRFKWGFISQREYLEFFQVAWSLRNREFPELKLLGGGVIDFEIPEHVGALYNRFPFQYDGYASLLYVDRRGAPENRQLGFNLAGKVDLLDRLVSGSDKLRRSPGRNLWITEVNWPLQETGLHAPALGDCRIGEVEQLQFLVRYFLIAVAAGSIAGCFWHQLIAPGYGLIDNRDDRLRKRPAFFGFATLCRLFNEAHIESFVHQDEQGYFQVKARRDGAEVSALWRCGGGTSIPMPPNRRALTIQGETIDIGAGQPLAIGESVVYLVET